MKRTLKSAARTAPPRLPEEPSLLIDETPHASQTALSQQQPPPALQNRRPKFIMTEEAVEQALQLVTDSKVNSKNAWDVKLIEGMQESVNECLGLLRARRSGEQREFHVRPRPTNTQSEADAYAQFSRAATLVEGGAKVWGHRVESTYLLSNQLVRRLLRNTDEEKDEKENDENEEQRAEQAPQRTKKKRTLERTLAETVDEINLEDRKNSKANAISAMARAMTEKFDHSHAQGLLLNNVPSGTAGNLILDRDDAKEAKAPPSGRSSGGQRGSASRRISSQMIDPFYIFEDENAEDIKYDMISLPTGSQRGPAGLDAEGADSQPFVADQEAIIQSATQQAVPFSGTPNKNEIQIIDDEDEGRREQSVFSGADFDTLVGGPMDDEGEDGIQFGDENEGGADDGDFDDGASEYYANRSVAEAARDIVLGQFEQEALHKKLALLAECPAGSAWVPLSQETAHLHSRGGAQATVSSALLNRIRKQCIGPAAALNPAGDDAALGAPAKKRRTEVGGKKTVKFSSDAMLDDRSGPADPDDSLSARLRLNKTPFTAMSKLGKLLAPAAVPSGASGSFFSSSSGSVEAASLMAFQNPQTCEDKAIEHRIGNRDIIEKLSYFYDNPTAGGPEYSSAATSVPVFLEWCPDRREAITDVLRLYQPFATASTEWSLLRKTTNSSVASKMLQGGVAGDGQTKSIIKRHSFGQGADGNPMFDEEIVAELPVDLFDQDDVDDDTPDGGTGLLNIPLAMDLPELSLGGAEKGVQENPEDKIQLISGPETIKVLKINQATVSTQVDVARLRKAMWTATSALCPPKEKQLSRRRKRGRDEDDDDEQDRQEDEPSQESSGSTFAHVVANVLPHVPTFSKEKTLSPAFFFFSLLFLANEHGLQLHGRDLSDVKISQ